MAELVFQGLFLVFVGGTFLGLVFYSLYCCYFDHLGPKKEQKGVLLEKKSDVRCCPSLFLGRYSIVRLRSRFWAVFLVNGERRVFFADRALWESLAEGTKYRLLCQGDRLLSVRR